MGKDESLEKMLRRISRVQRKVEETKEHASRLSNSSMKQFVEMYSQQIENLQKNILENQDTRNVEDSKELVKEYNESVEELNEGIQEQLRRQQNKQEEEKKR